MATSWTVRCDKCGKVHQGGTEKAQGLFGIPSEPVNVSFRYSNNSEDKDSTFLRADLCEDCGKELEALLRRYFPEPHWNKED